MFGILFHDPEERVVNVGDDDLKLDLVGDARHGGEGGAQQLLLMV